MKGDFTRKTFRKKKHYRKVNMQQGRVQLDADWNEQMDILLHHSSSALEDVIGKSGVPISSQKRGYAGFKIMPGRGNDYTIEEGHYYVDGILCENEADVLASNQPDLPFRRAALPEKEGTYLVYLDVWERLLTGLDDPEILDPALGGSDTATRTKTVWQVKVRDVTLPSKHEGDCRKLLCPSHSIPESGKMRARSRKAEPSGEGSNISPEAGYRRLSNQLYRVEIHDGGTVGTGKPPTFKWSRDNGSVVAKVKRFSDEIIVVPLGKDHELGFSHGCWVEVIDDRHELWGEPGTFVKLIDVKEVGDVNEIELKFDLSSVDGDPLTGENFPEGSNPKVRRWDMLDGVIKVTIPTENEGYIELEDGVEVRFEGVSYRTGDYWLIPARSATSEIMWPKGTDGPEPLPPEGIQHHFSSLALLKYQNDRITVVADCRRFFPATTNLPLIYYIGGDGQEASPRSELPFPLRVGVAIDPTQILGLKVRFIIKKGGGKVLLMEAEGGSDYLDIEIVNQLVECRWKLGNSGPQQVKAVLLNEIDAQISFPLYFNARIHIRDDSLEARARGDQVQELLRRIEKLEQRTPKIDEEIGSLKEKQTAIEQERKNLTKLTKSIATLEEKKRKMKKTEKEIASRVKVIEKDKKNLEDENFALAEKKKLSRTLQNLEKLEPEKNRFEELSEKLKEYREAETEKLYIENTQAAGRKRKIFGELTTKRKRFQVLEKEILANKKEYASKKEIFDRESVVLDQIESLEENRKTVESKWKLKTSDVAGKKAEIKGQNIKINELKKEILEKEQLLLKHDRYQQYRTWMDEYFIPATEDIEKHVMANIREEFDELFQRWFSQLIETGEITVRVDDNFTPLVEQSGYELDVKSLSGGEKTSVALAYRLALNVMVKKVCEAMHSNILMLDEPTDGFSTEQLVRVRDILDELKCEQVIMVSHERELEGFVDKIYRVRKEAGISSVLEA